MPAESRAMQATPLRYPELFLAPGEDTAKSFWISLRYFNLYRVAVATLFFSLSLIYEDQLNLGNHSLTLFRVVCGAYLLGAIGLHALLQRVRERFNVQLTVQVSLDIVAISLLMYASGGMTSGLGVMLLVSLIAAAIVAPPRLRWLYASLATIALLVQQLYWVLALDAPVNSFVPPALLALGCFGASSMTGWLAQRVATNERLALQRGRELAAQTRVNQLVLQDMHDGVLVLDRDGRVVQHNPQAQVLLSAGRLLGLDIEALEPRVATQWRAWRADTARSRAEGAAPARAVADVTLGGRELGVRLLDAGTEQGYSVLFIEDTTRAREQAQQLKLAALGRLTANIAHEIRNPLAAISHAAELLAEEKRAEDRSRLTRIIHDNTQRLERLVSDVLQLNRRDRVSAEPLRVNPWLREFLPEIAAVEGVAAQACALDAQGDPWVEFDHEHLRQVLWNLLRNAMRYARPGPGAVRVVVRGYGDRVELNVIDNGPGVPASSRGHLFEPFFTTDAKGTGLGLYLARELCAANHASLEYVADMPGAHFRILCRQARRQ
jgi:two-component system sensor histidine kinase PilS (NtrC family)